jgi:LDH2 family malate/lactate/ureidoglycolate dehydrogenase
LITEFTNQEILQISPKAIKENQEMKRVMNKVLWWLERGGDATHDHGLMHPCQIASAAREWLRREGIDLEQSDGGLLGHK